MDHLNNGIVMRIGSYLDFNSMLNLSGTSKSSRSQILGSKRLMSNCHLNISDLHAQKDFLKKYGENIKACKITKTVASFGKKELKKCLKAMPNLKKIVCESRILSKIEPTVATRLDYLLEMVLNDIAVTYFPKFVVCPNLEKLTLRVQKDRSVFTEGFMNWIASQSKLKTLILAENGIKIFLQNLPPVTFQLRTLHLIPGNRRNLSNDSDLIYKTHFFNFVEGQLDLEEVRFITPDGSGPAKSSNLIKDLCGYVMEGTRSLKYVEAYDVLINMTAENHVLEFLTLKWPTHQPENPFQCIVYFIEK